MNLKKNDSRKARRDKAYQKLEELKMGDDTSPVGIDISSEEYRVYTYGDGQKYKISAPKTLFITESGSHRVVDSIGMTHRPSPNFVGLSWKPREGAPAFVA